MEYYFNKTIADSFDNVIQKVTEALKAEGFGILTEIDIKATLKKKLDVDFITIKFWAPAIRRMPTKPCWQRIK